MIRLTPPTVPKYVSSGWGASRAYRGGWHAGLDFPAAKGSPMLAAADGRVVYVKNVSTSFAGKYPIIDHGNGVYTRYLHAEHVSAKVGQQVRRGEQIGTVGTTGTTNSAPHVHFDVKLSPAALAEYERRYGKPTTGFSGKLTVAGVSTRGAPAETFMDDATYKPGVAEASVARGVQFYRDSFSLALGVGLAAGVGWLLYRYVFR